MSIQLKVLWKQHHHIMCNQKCTYCFLYLPQIHVVIQLENTLETLQATVATNQRACISQGINSLIEILPHSVPSFLSFYAAFSVAVKVTMTYQVLTKRMLVWFMSMFFTLFYVLNKTYSSLQYAICRSQNLSSMF